MNINIEFLQQGLEKIINMFWVFKKCSKKIEGFKIPSSIYRFEETFEDEWVCENIENIFSYIMDSRTVELDDTKKKELSRSIGIEDSRQKFYMFRKFYGVNSGLEDKCNYCGVCSSCIDLYDEYIFKSTVKRDLISFNMDLSKICDKDKWIMDVIKRELLRGRYDSNEFIVNSSIDFDKNGVIEINWIEEFGQWGDAQWYMPKRVNTEELCESIWILLNYI